MKRFLLAMRKVGVTIVGVALIVLGLILIPLPGPGLLICLLGLLVLGYEYESAQNRADKLKAQLKALKDRVKQR